MSLYKSSCFPNVDRLVRALSFAMITYDLVIPSVFGLMFGKLAIAQTTYTKSDYLSLRDSVSVFAQNRHAYLTILFCAMLEVLILLLRAGFMAILCIPSIVMVPFLQLVHRTLEQVGRTLIKWGQCVATRLDLFSSDYASTKLCNIAFHTQREVLIMHLVIIFDIFERYDEVPVAYGSIAKIQQASLKYWYPFQKVKPIEVAVKVKDPGVSESIQRDFAILLMQWLRYRTS
ncbi:hypothetical protein Cgig2_021420 [Carnegiea gigantea]|uniref:ABC1 atypical kinase-like domain-containing protein n=1 Tax=Carnegiea gigantea TaxID=171969 RepID=A0A9Q1JGG7_9CARY|nr:hypothetical protein Cgig2_021420 [Carnegiea gigantea]